MNDLIENTLLPAMRNGLTDLFRVTNIRELESVENITLPPEVFKKTSAKVQETLGDRHERGVNFGYTAGRVTVLSEHLGTKIEPQKLQANSIDGTFFTYAQENIKIFFGKPVLIAFHTHPSVDLSFFEEGNVERFNWHIQKGQESTTTNLSLQTGSSMLETLATYPSAKDLENLMLNQRSWRSMLIGSKHGYVFIVNPNLQLPFIAQPRGVDEYKTRLTLALDQAATRTEETGNPDITTLRQDFTDALKTYCEDNKLLLFMNSDPRDPVLKKID